MPDIHTVVANKRNEATLASIQQQAYQALSLSNYVLEAAKTMEKTMGQMQSMMTEFTRVTKEVKSLVETMPQYSMEPVIDQLSNLTDTVSKIKFPQIAVPKITVPEPKVTVTLPPTKPPVINLPQSSDKKVKEEILDKDTSGKIKSITTIYEDNSWERVTGLQTSEIKHEYS